MVERRAGASGTVTLEEARAAQAAVYEALGAYLRAIARYAALEPFIKAKIIELDCANPNNMQPPEHEWHTWKALDDAAQDYPHGFLQLEDAVREVVKHERKESVP